MKRTSGFDPLHELDVRYTGDRRAVLLSPIIYHSKVAKQCIFVPAGTETDFLSTWGIPVIGLLFDGTSNKAALLHDYLYSCHMFTRAMSDAILREACIADGSSRLKAWVLWVGVRIGGGGANHWGFDDKKRATKSKKSQLPQDKI